jgi:hypothetical protein
MWTGGIQPVTIMVTRPIDDDNTRNDVNASLRIPLSMCRPYGADFDGDEMTLIGITGYQSEQECSAFNWDHDSYSPYVETDYNDIVHYSSPVIGDNANTAAICSTICWSDRFSNLAVTKSHSNWMTTKSAMIAMNQKHESAKAMALKAIVSMRIASSKSSSQSNVGASTRRSRIGAERLCLNEIGYPMLNTRAGTSLPLDTVFLNVSKDKGWYGNPAIRAVSKLCSSVMQLTLKVKSGSNVENLSPTLSLMSGSDSWLIIKANGSIDVHSIGTDYVVNDMDVVCSLFPISHASPGIKSILVNNLIDIVLIECNKRLDEAERTCLMLLLSNMTAKPMISPIGIQTVIGSDYEEFAPLTVFSASYVHPKFSHHYTSHKAPSTVSESMFIRQFANIPSLV